MANPSSFAPDFPPGLRTADLKTSFVGWGAYMALLTVYCTVYEVVVSGHAPDPADSFLWVLREWAVWWFITPAVLKALRQYQPGPGRLVPYLYVGAAVLVATVAFRATVDYLTEARGIGTILLVFVPRYLAVIVALFLIWHFFLRERAPAARPNAAVAPRETPEVRRRQYSEFLMASKGNGKCPVRVERIERVSAAGNYVEISSDNRVYLMRATMKQVEGLLPPSTFMRVHRSHIVNLNEIDRITSRPSGNGAVFLRSGKAVSISKRYRSRLENPRVPAG